MLFTVFEITDAVVYGTSQGSKLTSNWKEMGFPSALQTDRIARSKRLILGLDVLESAIGSDSSKNEPGQSPRKRYVT